MATAGSVFPTRRPPKSGGGGIHVAPRCKIGVVRTNQRAHTRARAISKFTISRPRGCHEQKVDVHLDLARKRHRADLFGNTTSRPSQRRGVQNRSICGGRSVGHLQNYQPGLGARRRKIYAYTMQAEIQSALSSWASTYVYECART